jgi:hypothetical protein
MLDAECSMFNVLNVDNLAPPRFDAHMRWLAAAIGSLVLVASIALRAQTPLPLVQADALPLSLDDRIQFRKFQIFRNTPPRPGGTPIPTRELLIQFERKRHTWGAITGYDYYSKTGQYFTFFWRATRPANLTLRLEYRQANLKNYVQGREINYPNARGSHESEFPIVGDDYAENGAITSWRAILIENGVIVAFLQSASWR